MRDGIQSQDAFVISENAGLIPHAAASVPLYRAGITPSSSRKLILLAGVSPGIRARVAQFECSLPVKAADVAALMDTCTRFCSLSDRGDMGGLPGYMIAKASSMMKQGDLHEAVDVLWCATRMSLPAVEAQEKSRPLLQEWLRGVGWEGADALGVKLRLAESLLSDVEQIANGGSKNVVTP